MRIAIGSDHRGFEVKQRLIPVLKGMGHEVIDVGPPGGESADYPDFAFQVAQAVADNQVQRGILICGTGIGMCIAANKVPGVRAAPCHDAVSAEMSRRHNDANVLCLSADMLSAELVERMVRTWLETTFDGRRHASRAAKILRQEPDMPQPRKKEEES